MANSCAWAGETDPLMIEYHDKEWGVPTRDDRTLFEFLVLEGAQAGLSWSTILKKRENYRRLFAGFDAASVAGFTSRKVDSLLQDAGIVRNRLKVQGTVINARLCLEVQREVGSFSEYLWSFVGGQPIQNSWRSLSDIPALTPESEAMSKDLRKRGFKFVGPTICYALMQATGMVNDHEVSCFRYRELGGRRRK